MNDLLINCTLNLGLCSKQIAAIPFVIWLILIGLGGGLVGGLISALIDLLIEELSKKTKSIAILGMKEAGKTTLWHALGGVNEYEGRTEIENTHPFQIGNITIKGSKDIGGNDNRVKMYDELMLPNTYIFFLFDVTKIKDRGYVKGILERLCKITKINKKFNEEERKGCGIKLIGTHIDQYDGNIEVLRSDLKGKLGKYKEVADHIVFLNLTDDNDIAKILKFRK